RPGAARAAEARRLAPGDAQVRGRKPGPVEGVGLLEGTRRPRPLVIATPGRTTGRVGGRRVDLLRDRAPRHEKNVLKPWLKSMWCIPPGQDAAFVCAMEQVLEVYRRPYDPRRPGVGMDEHPQQLISETPTPPPPPPAPPHP